MFRKHTKMIVVLFTIIALISAFCVSVKATDTATITSENTDTTNEVSTNTTEEVSEEETHDHNHEDDVLYEDLYIFDDSVTMDKIVDGNVYIFGDNVKITGKINGNLFVFGNDITFTTPYGEDDTEHASENYCYVSGSVFAFGNKINFNAVAQDVYAFSSIFDMSYNSYIMRDVRIAASDLTLKGYITRDAYLYAETFDFGTKGETEEDDDSALIAGDLFYSSSKEATIPETTVTGETKFTAIDTSAETEIQTFNVMDYVMKLVSTLVYTLAIYLIFAWLSPKFFEKTSTSLKTSTLPIAGIGVLTIISSIILIILSIILIFTCLYNISIILLTAIIILYSLNFATFAGTLTFLLKDKLGFGNKKPLLLVIITIVLWALKQIPFVGPIFTFIISIFGLGIIVKHLITRNKPLELKEQN